MSHRSPRPSPDRDSEPYWQALRESELRLQRCSGCGALRWPPRALCNRCRSFDAHWERLSGRGRLVSWVRTHQVFAPAYRDEVPYRTVQVALLEQDDILVIGGWQGGDDPVVGQHVEARFTVLPAAAEDEESFVLLDWAPHLGVAGEQD